MQKCATIWLQMKLTITEYSLTTSTKVNYKIQKERNLYLVLRLRGDTGHDTNDNVTTKTQSTFHTAHMNLNTWIDARVIPCAHSPVARFRPSWFARHIVAQVWLVRIFHVHTCSECFSSTLSSSISCSPSCTSSRTLRVVVTLRTPPKRRWTQLTNPTSSQSCCARPKARSQYSLRNAGKLNPESCSNCRFSSLTDSIIDVHVQHVGSFVIGNVESWSALHDLFHLFNALLVIDILTFSIWSEHDHRAIAAACVQRQNWTFRVSDFKIDVHVAARSVGERNITFDAVMLQRFTQHTLQIHAVLYFFFRNRRRIVHWTCGHSTSRVDNRSSIPTSNGGKHLSRWLI